MTKNLIEPYTKIQDLSRENFISTYSRFEDDLVNKNIVQVVDFLNRKLTSFNLWVGVDAVDLLQNSNMEATAFYKAVNRLDFPSAKLYKVDGYLIMVMLR